MNGLWITFILCIFFITLPRRVSLVPLFLATTYLTLGASVEVFGINFYALRILIFAGAIRVIIRKEYLNIKLNYIDKLLAIWGVSAIVIYAILYKTGGAFIYRSGHVYNAYGLYFIIRSVVIDLDDFERIMKITAFMLLPLAVIMCNEQLTGRNLFSIFGGVRDFSEIREGHIRSQGPFRHPILAGTYGATIMPLVASLWWQKRGKIAAIIGAIGCILIVITSRSSGPLMALLIGLLGMYAWRFRSHMRKIRWGIVISLLTLHFVIMKAPVWYLFDRLAGLIGGSGWYRAELIQQAVAHFGDWWLIGTDDTGSWMPFTLPDGRADITNQFISEGVNGGLLTLSLFIAIIVKCFKAVGISIRVKKEATFGVRITLWSLGAALLSHVMSFFSVGYFDQIIVSWYFLLGTIAMTCKTHNETKNSNLVGKNA